MARISVSSTWSINEGVPVTPIICWNSEEILSIRKRLKACIMFVRATFGAYPSSKLSDIAVEFPPKVLRKLDAWQLSPAAFSSISIKKPSSHSRQASNKHGDEVWRKARLRINGVKRISCNKGFA